MFFKKSTSSPGNDIIQRMKNTIAWTKKSIVWMINKKYKNNVTMFYDKKGISIL